MNRSGGTHASDADGSGDAALIVAHHHPGWLRVRARAFELDAGMRDSTICLVAALTGVVRVTGSPHTGSVLVEYDVRQTDVRDVLTALSKSTGLVLMHPPPAHLDPDTIYGVARTLDAHVSEWTGGRVGLRMAIPAALGIGSIASLVWSGEPLSPRWESLLYWSYHVFRDLNAAARDGEHAFH